jgi:hypothetical protein
VKNKGADYYACLAVQGAAMIITFTGFGAYFDRNMSLWFGNVWACSLILGVVAIILALVVIYVLLEDNPNEPAQEKVVQYIGGNFRTLLAFWAQIAIVQIYYRPK